MLPKQNPIASPGMKLVGLNDEQLHAADIVPLIGRFPQQEAGHAGVALILIIFGLDFGLSAVYSVSCI